MAKKKYPVVDIENCLQCKKCIYACKEMVYDRIDVRFPKVVRPEKCQIDCSRCLDRCTKQVIDFVFYDD